MKKNKNKILKYPNKDFTLEGGEVAVLINVNKSSGKGKVNRG